MAASMNEFMVRRLEDIIPVEGGDDLSESTNTSFDSVLFWSVNAIWITALASVIIWIWKCGGAECLTESVRRDSDATYRRRLAQRQRAEREKRKVSPDKRKKLLMEYFRSNKVHMVVSQEDIVQDPDGIVKDQLDQPVPDENGVEGQPPSSGPSVISNFDIEAGSDAGSVTESPAESALQDATSAVLNLVDLDAGSDAGSVTESPTGIPTESVPRDATNAEFNLIDLESASDSDNEPQALEIDTGVALDDSSRSSSSRKSGLLSMFGNSIASALDVSFKGAFGNLDDSLKSGLSGGLDGSIRSIDQGFLILGNKQRVPNCCAVCLGAYEVGEDVVWSNNCLHAFHEECVTSWLAKMQDGNPCPCCRSVFVELDPDEPPAPKRVEHVVQHRAFNFGIVRL